MVVEPCQGFPTGRHSHPSRPRSAAVTEVAGKMATMKPSTEAELAAILQGANAPLRVRGGGTRGLHEHQAPVIETAGLAGITLYEPGALTLVVRAGTPLDTVAQVLAAFRQGPAAIA
jgi:FAD/FMN-containing dehydrogenase